MIGIFQAVLAQLAAQQSRRQSPLSSEGWIDRVVEPQKIWRVCHRSTFWFARSHRRIDFHPGDWVKVVDRIGIILYIEPLEEKEPEE